MKTSSAYVDPFSEMERWFYNLPCRYLSNICHCGSGKPVLYWSPDDGTGCEDCRGSLFVYIPAATMYNIMNKFNFPPELQKAVYDQLDGDLAR